MKEIFFTASLFFPGDVPVHSPDCRKMTSDSPERRPDKPCVWCGLLREKMKAYNKKCRRYDCGSAGSLPAAVALTAGNIRTGAAVFFPPYGRGCFISIIFRTPVQEHRLLRTKSQSHEYYPYYR